MLLRRVTLLLALALVASTGCNQNLLADRAPVRAHGLRDAARVTDGAAPPAGAEWNTSHTAVLADAAAMPTWDLGASASVRWVYLQADNNDDYILEISEDGSDWRSLWVAGPVPLGGMQARFAEVEARSGRYLRLRASGGDGAYSLGEVAVFAEKPTPWPPVFETAGAPPNESHGRRAIAAFFVLAGGFIIAFRQRGFTRAWLLPVGALAALLWWILPAWPPRPQDVALFKAALALLTIGVLVRSWRGTAEYALGGRSSVRMLAAIAVLSTLSYYEFGRLEFRNEADGGRPTFVHTWDMRHYFPLAKYFSELRFDGLYFASIAAWLDDEPGVTQRELAAVRIRDLRDNRVVTVDQVMGPVQEAKARFTPARWESFREDMRFFRETMGKDGYLGTVTDHGGNATPVWLVTGWAVFAGLPANEWVLSATGLIDPLLLALMFFCIARAFGARAMLLCLIVFGVTDFARFGATLVGSSLRYDWVAALGLGVCALRTQRWALGGALLAWGGLVRAFPALALVFLAVPAAFEAIGFARAKKRLPRLHELEGATPLLRAAAGATATVVVLVGLSVALFSWEAGWGAWFEKILPHAGKPNVNHVGLRTVIAYESANVASRLIDWSNPEPWWRWQQTQTAAWEARRPLYLLAAGALVSLAVLAARRRRLDQAALVGMMVVPALFYPANYYYHYILLLPLLAVGGREGEDTKPESPFATVSVALLALCAAQYPTGGMGWADESFTWQTWLVLGTFTATCATLVHSDRSVAAQGARNMRALQ